MEEDRPYLVGEEGPEMFVPDDPWARAAARTGRRGRQEGAGTRFVEGGYGIPAAYRALDRSAQDAFESAGSLQRGGSYDPAPVVNCGARCHRLSPGGRRPAGRIGWRWGWPAMAWGLQDQAATPDLRNVGNPCADRSTLAEKTIAPEALQGGWLMPAVGDRSRAGFPIVHDGRSPSCRRRWRCRAAPASCRPMPARGSAWASTTPLVGSGWPIRRASWAPRAIQSISPTPPWASDRLISRTMYPTRSAEGLKVKPPSAASGGSVRRQDGRRQGMAGAGFGQSEGIPGCGAR